MIVGLEGWTPEDADLFDEWGVKWTKMPVCDVDTGGHSGNIDCLRACAEAGLTVIADLRPSDALHAEIRNLPTNPNEEKADELLALLAKGAAETVRKLDGICSHVEWWGEYDCPYVSGFWPNKRSAYPTYLQALHDAVKEVRPEVQVWNGGYGVNFQPQFLDALCLSAPAGFDAANWHAYNISEYWPRNADGMFQFGTPIHKRVRHSADKFRTMFAGARERMTEAGCAQPFASSEWGMPVVTDEVVEMLRGAFPVTSNVWDDQDMVALVDAPDCFTCSDGVYALSDTDAALFFEAWMQVFEDVGFEVLIYHRLRDDLPYGPDHDGTFWGLYCGLMYSDGAPKTHMVEAFRRWVARGAS